MLADFWHLNGNNNQTVTQAQLVNLMAANHLIENVIYQPGLFAPVRPQSIVGGKVLRNVSFRSAHIQGIEFRSSRFEDCLFMGAIFEHCEFHDCTFVGCNPYKARFINTYIDPKVFDRTLVASSSQISFEPFDGLGAGHIRATGGRMNYESGFVFSFVQFLRSLISF